MLVLLGSCRPTANENAANRHMNESSFAELVNKFDSPERVAWQKPMKVIEFMQLEDNDVVADIGAGTGYFSFLLTDYCRKVIAIDVDERFTQLLEKRKKEKGVENLEIRLGEEDSPEIERLECDKVLVVNTVHHFQKVAKYLSRVRSRMRFGGSLFIVDFKAGQLPVGPPDKMKISLERMKKELALAGFKSLKVDTTTLPYQYMIKAH